VILDTPPSLSLVSENVLRASDVVLIPTVLSVRTFDQLSAFVADLKGAVPVLGGHFSMLDRRRKLHRDILSSPPTARHQMSAIAITSASAVEQMAVRRRPVVAVAPRSPAALAFQELWREVATSLAMRLLRTGGSLWAPPQFDAHLSRIGSQCGISLLAGD